MEKRINRSTRSENEWHSDQHRFEHWYIDNQVYFITARCREGFPAFASAEACDIFWDRFDHYTAEAGFVPWVTTLIYNHYHTVGYLREGMKLPRMMQRIHGSVAKLVNDVLEAKFGGARGANHPAQPAEAGLAGVARFSGPVAFPLNARGRLLPFWREGKKGKEYYDGALRDAKQCRLSYTYTLTQCVRAGICADPREYPNTRVKISLERGLRRALELGALLEGVPYRRYHRYPEPKP